MRIRIQTVGAFLALPLFLTSLSACGSGGAEVVDGPWKDVVAAANDEGEVNVYSIAPPAQNDRLIAAFEKKYPDLEVTVTRGAGELPGRVESEMQSKSDGADVFMYSDPQFFVSHADDLLEIDGPSVEGWRDDYWAKKDKAIIPTKYPWTTLVWNTDMFPSGFKNWPDLLEPGVKGKLGVYKQPTVSNCSTVAFMEEGLGADYLTELGRQKPRYYASTVPMIQAIASGEVGVATLAAPVSVKDLKDQGAPIDSAYPSPGFALMWGAGALATSHRPNAARVFLDFVMSEEGQVAINADGFGSAGRSNVPGALDELDGWAMFDAEACGNPDAIEAAEAKLNKYYP